MAQRKESKYARPDNDAVAQAVYNTRIEEASGWADVTSVCETIKVRRTRVDKDLIDWDGDDFKGGMSVCLEFSDGDWDWYPAYFEGKVENNKPNIKRISINTKALKALLADIEELSAGDDGTNQT